ncbi:early boundary activity protein 2 [Drosophila tropicalis]|uniref:early boundary activity protein 2 n=1 Tax=Drosophila tropicalis TaxID=46794 RepID=UPI0035ABB520
MAANYPYLNENEPRATNSVVNGICTSVLPQPSFGVPHLPAYPVYTNHYLSQLAPQFVPYYYKLLTRPIMTSEEMDIENYINCEVATQRANIMRKQIARPPLGQLQLPKVVESPPKPLPLKKPEPPKLLPIVIKEEPIPNAVTPPRRIYNATLVTLGPRIRSSSPKRTIDPLPPVDPKLKEQVLKIQKSQDNYSDLFGRLTSMLRTLDERYDAPMRPAKRLRRNLSTSSSESQPEVTNSMDYPRRVQLADGSFAYVLGPNGTQITAHQYGEVFWTNAPVATRCLLTAVFTNDELATHTLTGKPSPAFYGRERPAKLQLDQAKVDDIIVCVRNRTEGKERSIRAAITTKCADVDKKYKRRALKGGNENKQKN